MHTAPIRVVDLFAGAGGLTAGFHDASDRFRTISAVEIDASAASSFEATFGPGIIYNGPIQKWLDSNSTPSDVDVVVGGPPCQGFSTLGRRDENDERNFLWKQYATALIRMRPRYFVVENVAAFARSSQFRDFQEAIRPGGILSGYDFKHQILNAADYGSFQARKRAVLIGHRRDLPFPGFPRPTHSSSSTDDLLPYRTVREAFLAIPNKPDMDKHFRANTSNGGGEQSYSPRELHWNRDYRPLSLKRFATIPPGGNRFDLPDELKAPCWRNHSTGSGDVMGRLHLDRPSVTIRTEFFKPEKGRYLHPTEPRAITHYEAAVLQGFKDNHRFVGSRTAIARQIGNAVPIPLGRAIALQLLQHF